MKKRVLKVVAVVLAACFYALLITYTPFGLKCWLYEFTGIYCPGCGMSRGVISLLHLDFYQAFRYNCLIIPVIPVTAVLFLISAYQYIRYGNINNTIIIRVIVRWYPLIVVALLMFAVLRNIFPVLVPTVIS